MSDHVKFMRQALEQARLALLDDEFPVGCVIVAENTIVATGGRKNSAVEMNEFDHAEIVALRDLPEEATRSRFVDSHHLFHDGTMSDVLFNHDRQRCSLRGVCL